MAVATYTKAGAKASTPAKLDKAVFGVEVENHELLKSAYTAYLANGRMSSATTKTRGLVRGGGKKPWRQKGTGRARFGSTRNPIWRGGGVVFGPSGLENYSQSINSKAKRQAIRQALSLASEVNQLIVIEDVPSKGKTADLAKLLAKIGATKNILIIVDVKSPELIRAAANIQQTKLVGASYLNVFDILNADHLIFSQAALKQTTDWLNGKAAKLSPGKEAK